MIEIRSATLEDVDGIAKVHVNAWRTTYRGIVPDDFLDRLSYEKRASMWRDVIQRATPREHLLVAVNPMEGVIGFTSGGKNRGAEYPFDGELFAIYLLKEHQERGTGRRLFQATVDRLVADRFTSMLVWVLEGNPTCRFYERMGGKTCGEKLEEIGGKPLKELAYCWGDLSKTGAAHDELVETGGGAARACKRMHESGHPMIVIQALTTSDKSPEAIDSILLAARQAVDPSLSIIRVCLEANQEPERALLEGLGFAVDGFEFSLDLEKLRDTLVLKGTTLPAGLSVRKMAFDLDIDAVVELEKTVHAADQTSRVNFDSEAAIAGMRNYYKKAASGNGVYLLIDEDSIVGLVGFMPDHERADAIHISSVAIALSRQGQGLFFPLLLNCLMASDFKQYRLCTGVTTTSRLIEAAKRHSADLLGVSLIRKDASVTTEVLEPRLWPALERFFLAEKCSGCWCMNHRLKTEESLEGEFARLAFAEAVNARRASGVLAFDGAKPIGWCAFDRMADLPGLDCGYPVPESQRNDVWSIHCLSVLSGYPRVAVIEQMIAAATRAAISEGALVIEGYPPPALPSGNTFSGTVSAFERQGYRLREKISRHYVRMIKSPEKPT